MKQDISAHVIPLTSAQGGSIKFSETRSHHAAQVLEAHVTCLDKATSAKDELLQVSVKLPGIIDLGQDELPLTCRKAEP
jgi:hypothetical protein